MKLVLRSDVLNDNIEVLKIFDCMHEHTKSVEHILEDVDIVGIGKNIQVVHVNKSRIEVFNKGLIYGKSLIYIYFIDSYFNDKFDLVVKELAKDNQCEPYNDGNESGFEDDDE
jgi:hypothetical protein